MFPLLSHSDWLVLLAATGLVVVSFMTWWTPGDNRAEFVYVTSGDGHQDRHELNQDRLIELEGRLGKSVLEIQQGKVRFASASCPNQYCVKAGWLDKSGSFAACLPNGLSLMLGSRAQVYDAINF